MRTATVLLCLTALCRADVFVSPSGNDRNPGTEQAPFATLERARDAVRGTGGVVWLCGGVYERSASLALGPEDSGVMWYGLPGQPVRIVGGHRISGFVPSPGRSHIWQIDLKAAGITNFGKLTPRGFGRPPAPAALELFFNGKPMPLARWPNRGWAYTASAPGGPQGGRFTVATDRLKIWASARDVWVHGYWTYDWADSYERVASIDVEAQEIRTVPPHGVYGYMAGRRFEVLNVLEELDEPGEWYLDRDSGILYFWPPGPLEDAEVWVSLLETPLVILRNTENVRFENIIFEYTRGLGVQITGGTHKVLARCTLRNIGMRAVSIDGGSVNGVEDSEIYETGEGGISLTGGDRRTLTPSGHFASGNRIWNFSRWVRTYRPALALNGVGVIAYRNLLFHAPHQAIALSGNDHLIQGNHIHTVGWETQDVGALYFGRDWTWRGNVIRGNFFQNQGNGDVNSVYLDDCASGTLVEGNVFHRARRSVFIGGGRDNIVRDNLFFDSDPAVEVDARGLTWATKWFDGTDPVLFERLKAVPYQQPPWSDRYPELVNLLEDEPAVPKGNVIVNNFSYGGRWLNLRDGTSQWVRVENNHVEPASRPPEPFDDLGAPVPIVAYRIEVLQASSPLRFRLVVENLGKVPAQGELLLWAWPQQGVHLEVTPEVPYRLDPGEVMRQEFEAGIDAMLKEVFVGAQMKDDGFRPPAVRVVVKR